METPQEHIDWAIGVEKNVSEKEMSLYLDCMNNKPMSQRTESREIYDGCILTGIFVRITKTY